MIAKDYKYQTVTVNSLYLLYKDDIDAILEQQFRWEDTEGKGNYTKLGLHFVFFWLYMLNLHYIRTNNNCVIDYDKLVQCCSSIQFKDWLFKYVCEEDYSSDYSDDYASLLPNEYSPDYSDDYKNGQDRCDLNIIDNKFLSIQKSVKTYCN
jgi:hypothetical protein